MAHQTGVVRNAPYLKQHFIWIMVATGNQNNCPPENQHFFLTELKSANAMKIKVHHTGPVRISSFRRQNNLTALHGWKQKKTPHSKPKIFNVKEKLQLSWCQRNHGKSYWSGTNSLTFKRTLWLNHGGKTEPEQMPSRKPTHLFEGTKKKLMPWKLRSIMLYRYEMNHIQKKS